jgi:phosphonate transport system permease protein
MRPPTAIEYFLQTYLPMDWSVLPDIKNPLIETLQMAFVGSFIGSALALPAAILASSNIVKSNYVLVPVRLVLSFLRTLPIIIYASLFVLVVGLGALPGILAIIVFTFSIVAKMLFERIETVDMGAYEAIQSTGATKLQSFTTAIMPQILPSFYSMSLYAFEINVRYAAILGYVGAGGIGDYLNKTFEANKQGVLTVLLFIWIVVVLIELTSKQLRRRFS